MNEFAWSCHSDYLLAATAGEGVGAIDLIAVHPNSNTSSDHSNNQPNTSLDTSFTDAVSSPSKQSHNQVPGLQVVESFIAHSSNCFNVCIDSSYARMAVSSFDCCVSLWDLSDLVCKLTIALE